MKEVDTAQIQGFLIGQLIITLIGGLLIVAADFAGFYHYDYYTKVEQWGSVYLGSGLVSSALIVAVAAGLFIAAWQAFQILKDAKITAEKVIHLEATAEKPLMVSAAITVAGGLVFAISSMLDGTEEWWFDAGFYGALVGSVLGLVFIKQIVARVKMMAQQQAQ